MGIIAALASIVVVAFAAPSFATTASGQITPKSTLITLTSTTTTFTAGGITLTCSTFSISGTTNANGTSATASAAAKQITFTGCKAIGGLVTAVVEAHGTWDITGGSKINPADDSWNVNIGIGTGATPAQGAASITLSTGCVLTVAVQAISGSTATDSLTSLEVTDATVAFTSNGVGLGCPASGNANFTASGAASFITTPAITIS